MSIIDVYTQQITLQRATLGLFVEGVLVDYTPNLANGFPALFQPKHQLYTSLACHSTTRQHPPLWPLGYVRQNVPI